MNAKILIMWMSLLLLLFCLIYVPYSTPVGEMLYYKFSGWHFIWKAPSDGLARIDVVRLGLELFAVLFFSEVAIFTSNNWRSNK